MKKSKQPPKAILHKGRHYVLDRKATAVLERREEKLRVAEIGPNWFEEAAEEIARSVREDYPKDEDSSAALHEVVDGAVPVYYAEITELLGATDLGHIPIDDIGVVGDSPNAFSFLQAVVYQELMEKANEALENYEPEEEDEDEE